MQNDGIQKTMKKFTNGTNLEKKRKNFVLYHICFIEIGYRVVHNYSHLHELTSKQLTNQINFASIFQKCIHQKIRKASNHFNYNICE